MNMNNLNKAFFNLGFSVTLKESVLEKLKARAVNNIDDNINSRRAGAFMAIRYVVFKKDFETLRHLCPDVTDKREYARMMDAIAFIATNVAYESIRCADRKNIELTVMKTVTDPVSGFIVHKAIEYSRLVLKD